MKIYVLENHKVLKMRNLVLIAAKRRQFLGVNIGKKQKKSQEISGNFGPQEIFAMT